jgi:hypothetical protein
MCAVNDGRPAGANHSRMATPWRAVQWRSEHWTAEEARCDANTFVPLGAGMVT